MRSSTGTTRLSDFSRPSPAAEVRRGLHYHVADVLGANVVEQEVSSRAPSLPARDRSPCTAGRSCTSGRWSGSPAGRASSLASRAATSTRRRPCLDASRPRSARSRLGCARRRVPLQSPSRRRSTWSPGSGRWPRSGLPRRAAPATPNALDRVQHAVADLNLDLLLPRRIAEVARFEDHVVARLSRRPSPPWDAPLRGLGRLHSRSALPCALQPSGGAAQRQQDVRPSRGGRGATADAGGGPISLLPGTRIPRTRSGASTVTLSVSCVPACDPLAPTG